MLGDVNHYASPYMRGVKQAMELLGHEHAEVSIRSPARTIEQRIRLWQPAVIWTHMLLWAPIGSPKVADLIAIMQRASKRAHVVIHDGDAKAATRHPQDISSWCSLALVNHAHDRSAWRVPVLRWPYFAMAQEKIAPAQDAMRCGLFFAGTLGGGIYAKRTALLLELQRRGVAVRMPTSGDNTIGRTAEIAASADAVLGFGRPDVPGWCDVRVFQYPGAGAILVHDDTQGHLEPWEHFVPYESGSADSIVAALEALRAMPEEKRGAMRRRAFLHVQANHSSLARCRQVFAELRAA
jgi:hypothetical protein